MKSGVQILIAVLLLAAAGVFVWYVMFYLQNPEMLTDVTMVCV